MNPRVSSSSFDESRLLAADAAQLSLVRSGPLERLQRRFGGLPGNTASALRQRAMWVAILMWLPLAVLTVAQGLLTHTTLYLAFARDLATHVRCLIAVPLLIFVEPFIDFRFGEAGRVLVTSGVIPRAHYGAFREAMSAAVRRRDNGTVPFALGLLAWGGSYAAFTASDVPKSADWMKTASGGFTLAGDWQLLLGLPAFQFLVGLWLWRWINWSLLLWRISRMDLQLMATHPDRAGGLGVIAQPAAAFALVPFAVGTVLSASWMRLVLFSHTRATVFRTSIIAFAIIVLIIALGPMVVFARRLFRVRHDGVIRYGLFLHAWVEYFNRHWVQGDHVLSDDELQQAPVQSLANVADVHKAAEGTRLVPFDPRTIIILVAGCLVPMLPLVLTVVPISEIAKKLLKAFV